jgi:hypothetical protein
MEVLEPVSSPNAAQSQSRSRRTPLPSRAFKCRNIQRWLDNGCLPLSRLTAVTTFPLPPLIPNHKTTSPNRGCFAGEASSRPLPRSGAGAIFLHVKILILCSFQTFQRTIMNIEKNFLRFATSIKDKTSSHHS